MKKTGAERYGQYYFMTSKHLWYGTSHAGCVLDPKTIEEAIAIAITHVFETSHPELTTSEALH